MKTNKPLVEEIDSTKSKKGSSDDQIESHGNLTTLPSKNKFSAKSSTTSSKDFWDLSDESEDEASDEDDNLEDEELSKFARPEGQTELKYTEPEFRKKEQEVTKEESESETPSKKTFQSEELRNSTRKEISSDGSKQEIHNRTLEENKANSDEAITLDTDDSEIQNGDDFKAIMNDNQAIEMKQRYGKHGKVVLDFSKGNDNAKIIVYDLQKNSLPHEIERRDIFDQERPNKKHTTSRNLILPPSNQTFTKKKKYGKHKTKHHKFIKKAIRNQNETKVNNTINANYVYTPPVFYQQGFIVIPSNSSNTTNVDNSTSKETKIFKPNIPTPVNVTINKNSANENIPPPQIAIINGDRTAVFNIANDFRPNQTKTDKSFENALNESLETNDFQDALRGSENEDDNSTKRGIMMTQHEKQSSNILCKYFYMNIWFSVPMHKYSEFSLQYTNRGTVRIPQTSKMKSFATRINGFSKALDLCCLQGSWLCSNETFRTFPKHLKVT